MAKLRVLFIDDDAEGVRPARQNLEEETYKCHCVSFPGFQAALADFRPHIAIVDRMEGDAPLHENTGRRVFDEIWQHRFCPVIIYTAFPDDERDDRESHPLVRYVTKGQNLDAFRAAIEELAPHAHAIENAEQHIHGQFAIALRDISSYAATAFDDPAQRLDVVVRQGRRRLAALMDEETMGKLASWEQYIYPPVSKCLMLGDIIRLQNRAHDDPTAFCVILTPSCDLVSEGDRKPKVEQVLVAKCCSPRAGIQKASLGRDKRDKQTEVVRGSLLSQGYFHSIVPFPALKGVIPALMADLKSLRLLPIADVSPAQSGNSNYARVASLDSPFRELVSWAYLQTACRPGLPDRDLDAWSKEIVEACGL
ncbi:MAG: response regulator [Acidobacteria bacterium]|nr:response regulator [Acidobacteriota bacterium]